MLLRHTFRYPKLLPVVALIIAASGISLAAGPPAPSVVSPANGATVQLPLTISWTSVNDSAGLLAYAWQVSTSSSFSVIAFQNSNNGQSTQGAISGLANGRYFWRVQAIDNNFVQGAWSATQSFTVSGAAPGALAAPVLGPPKGYSTFHPLENMTFNWSVVPGAATYLFQFATDSSFPVATRGQFDNLPTPTDSFATPDQGNYFARALAVSANGALSQPSNVITFSVFYSNPLPPPPSPLSPANGATLTLPVILNWSDVLNPQPSGYEVQIAKDSGFANVEEDDPQLNEPTRTVLSLTPGTKFWRVRSTQGDASPTTGAVTAWSTPGSFTMPRPTRPGLGKLHAEPGAQRRECIRSGSTIGRRRSGGSGHSNDQFESVCAACPRNHQHARKPGMDAGEFPGGLGFDADARNGYGDAQRSHRFDRYYRSASGDQEHWFWGEHRHGELQRAIECRTGGRSAPRRRRDQLIQRLPRSHRSRHRGDSCRSFDGSNRRADRRCYGSHARDDHRLVESDYCADASHCLAPRQASLPYLESHGYFEFAGIVRHSGGRLGAGKR